MTTKGIDIISETTKTLPEAAGVYRMLNAKGDVLYVGKAMNLKKRVVSYTKPDKLSNRIQRMIFETASMEFTVTGTERDALLLENNLIKNLVPKYNILLRDDKTYAHVLITGDHDYPQILKHRGAKNRKGTYFGPFASGAAVYETLTTIQKVFRLRVCTDNTFANRTRPCLQYFIKRCTGPCVGKISKDDYLASVKQAKDFLSGKSTELQNTFSKQMQEASKNQDYETAAMYRDKIRALTTVQSRQDIILPWDIDVDVFGLALHGGEAAVHVTFFRGGQSYGDRVLFFKNEGDYDKDYMMAHILMQFYDEQKPPGFVYLSFAAEDSDVLADILQTTIEVPQRGPKKEVCVHADRNAEIALKKHVAEKTHKEENLKGLAAALNLIETPKRIEVYDNSHTFGSNALGVMIVHLPTGFAKKEYRKYNIKNADLPQGDDYGMMREVLTRRFQRALKEDPDRSLGLWPDLVIIDGGAGQLSASLQIFQDLGIEDIPLLAIAKGVDRNAGREKLHMKGRDMFQLPFDSPILYMLQNLRDEAHRFAIGSHRKKRDKASIKSELDEIPGIGGKRRKALLNHFGAVRDIRDATVRDLKNVEGISESTAQKIYDFFRKSS